MAQFFPADVCCLQRVYWEGRGGRGIPREPDEACEGMDQLHSLTPRVMELNFTDNGECREVGEIIVKLRVDNGEVVQRQDQFALFIGDFELRDANDLAHFTGRIVTIDTIGTHLSGDIATECAELCAEPNHFEGWLDGQSVDQQNPTFLKAVIAGWTRRGVVSVIDRAVINGTIFTCPLPPPPE